MYILDDNSLKVIPSLPIVQVHVVVYIDLYAYSAIIWRSNHASNGHLQEGRNNEKFLERLIVAVA